MIVASDFFSMEMKIDTYDIRDAAVLIWAFLLLTCLKKTLPKSYLHVTLMNPSFHLPSSQYCHRENPSLALAPASGDEGEFVALPLVIQAPESDLLTSFTSR